MEIREDVIKKIKQLLNLNSNCTDLDLLEAIINLKNNSQQITYVPSPTIDKYPYWDNAPHIID